MNNSISYFVCIFLFCSINRYNIIYCNEIDYSTNEILVETATVENCLKIILELDKLGRNDVEKINVFYKSKKFNHTIELLGALRNKNSIPILVPLTSIPIQWSGSSPKAFHDFLVYTALARIGDTESIESLLDQWVNIFGIYAYLEYLIPKTSILALIDDYNERHQTLTDDQKKKLQSLHKWIVLNVQEMNIDTTDERGTSRRKQLSRLKIINQYQDQSLYRLGPSIFYELPPLSDFVLNHPLYKTRQMEIETNITILKSQKKWTVLDMHTFSAVNKLGELRAVEAVEILVPKLLLKPDSTVKLTERKIDEKYVAIKDYPVAITLSEIGIPSIWGLLDEIAKSEDGTEYREIAYQTMTAILPAVAIPGFVNESLKKHTGELEQLRLYKMYPLMGLPIEGTPLIPRLREWQSTDKLFKTNAKFISLENGDVTLERANGQHTTIEYSVLRKEDQDYVKMQLESETKISPDKTTKD